MPTKKDGTKVTWKQFFQEWKAGMEKVTPLQQAVITQMGHIISGVGIIWGIVFSIRLAYYWMIVVLSGGLIVLAAQYLGNYQKKMILKRMDLMIKEAEGGQNGF